MKHLLHSGPGLVIGIPTLGRPVPLDWALALKSMNTPINFNVNFHLVKGKSVDDARNDIARFFGKQSGVKFFVGIDNVYQMMLDSFSLIHCGFCRADIQIAVNL